MKYTAAKSAVDIDVGADILIESHLLVDERVQLIAVQGDVLHTQGLDLGLVLVALNSLTHQVTQGGEHIIRGAQGVAVGISLRQSLHADQAGITGLVVHHEGVFAVEAGRHVQQRAWHTRGMPAVRAWYAGAAPPPENAYAPRFAPAGRVYGGDRG